MFIIKFPENDLITQFKIVGPFITIFVPEKKESEFQQNHQQLLAKYRVLSLGQGALHDFAHDQFNSDFLSFFSRGDKSAEEHFHFLLTERVTSSNLKEFLTNIESKYLSDEQKDAITDQYRDYLEQPMSFKVIEESLRQCRHIGALLHEFPRGGIELVMPDLAKFLDVINKQGLDENSPTSLIVNVNHQNIKFKNALDNFGALINHLKLLIDISKILVDLKPNTEKGDEDLSNIRRLFTEAKKVPLPNFTEARFLFTDFAKMFPILKNGLSPIYKFIINQLKSEFNVEGLDCPVGVETSTDKVLKFEKSFIHFRESFDALGKELDNDLRTKIISGHYNFTDADWADLDTKTLADYKAYALACHINKLLLSLVIPNLDYQIILQDMSYSPDVLKLAKPSVAQILTVFDSIKVLVDSELNDTLAKASLGEKVVEFLKACVNVLITILTLGFKQNFFASNTHYLELVKNTQAQMHELAGQLDDLEKSAQFDFG